MVVVFEQSIKAWCQVENENVLWAAPTGDVPTTSEQSTILFLTNGRLESEIWRYAYLKKQKNKSYLWSRWYI